MKIPIGRPADQKTKRNRVAKTICALYDDRAESGLQKDPEGVRRFGVLWPKVFVVAGRDTTIPGTRQELGTAGINEVAKSNYRKIHLTGVKFS